MGKAGRKKVKNRMARRHHPTGLPSLREMEQQENLLLTDAQPEPLPALKKLSSTSSEDREAGTLALASLVADPIARDTLIDAGLPQRGPSLLLDPDPAVRTVGAGMLRNAVVHGEEEVVTTMVTGDGDVMTAITTALRRTMTAMEHAGRYGNNGDDNLSHSNDNNSNNNFDSDIKMNSSRSKNKNNNNNQNNNNNNNNNDNDTPSLATEIEEGLRLLEQLLPLLSFICESSETATIQISGTNSTVLADVFTCLSHPYMTDVVKEEAIQFLTIVTDENETVAHQIRNNSDAMSLLDSLINNNINNENNENNSNPNNNPRQYNSSMFIKTCSAVVLFNIRPLDQHVAYVQTLLPVLMQSMEYDVICHLSEIWNAIHQSRRKDEVSLYIPWRTATKAQRSALELLTNVISSVSITEIDDPETVEEWTANNNNMPQVGPDQVSGSALNPQVLELLIHHNVFDVISRKLTQLAQRIVAMPSTLSSNTNESRGDLDTNNEHLNTFRFDNNNNNNNNNTMNNYSGTALLNETITERVTEDVELVCGVMQRCMTCLGNMVINLDHDTLQQYDIGGMWHFMVQLCHAVMHHIETLSAAGASPASLIAMLDAVLENSTSTICSTLKKLTSFSPNISEENINLFTKMATEGNSEILRMYSVGIMGGLGARCSDPKQNLNYGEFLLNKLHDPSLLVISETLDALFDVYGDENLDQNVIQLNLISHLKQFLQEMGNKIQEQKKQVGRDVLMSAIEARVNLQRFIEYKEENIQAN